MAEPLLAVLHLGYLWLAVGLGLLGVSLLMDRVTEAMALHVLTIGAMGTMTLAVMMRATLGHTGRKLRAGPCVDRDIRSRDVGGIHSVGLRDRAGSRLALGERR